jgi:16S rRNA processing protein RimM
LIETAGPEPATPLADVRLTVGRIGGTHGVRGELKMRNLTDDPEHLKRVERVYLGNADTPIALKGVRFTKDGALITLEGVTTPEAGARLSGLPVKIAGTDARPLEEGEYFLFQLIGLEVLTEDGTPAGTVTDLMETGAHDVLVIGERPDAADDLLVPNHPEFVLEISPEKGTIIIRPPVYGN